MTRIEIKTRHPSLNDWLSVKGGRFKIANDKKQFEEEILWELKAQKCPIFQKPIMLHVTQFTKHPRDHDNCVLSAKFCGDALRAGRYIPDDTHKFIVGVFLQWQKARGDEKVVYLINEVDVVRS